MTDKNGMVPLFVYSKDGKIKVLDIENAKLRHNGLMLDNYTFDSTLDVCMFLENLHNDLSDEEKVEAINNLKR